ncbi:MAG: PEP-CTERM sorting domain-containing protein [Myxococcota bacterium]
MYRPPCQRPRRSVPTANPGSQRRRGTGPRLGRGAALLFAAFAVLGLGGRGQATPISFRFDDYRYGGSTFTIDSYKVGATSGSRWLDSYRVEHVRDPGGILAGAVEAWAPVEISLQRADSAGMAFDTDVLPLRQNDLSDFPGFRDFRLSFGENLDAGPHVSDPGSSPSPVPEPSTGWLLAAGLTGLVACRRRCRPSV